MARCSSSYDVCIVGAGPAALACLSAIREPYSIDHLTEAQVQRAVHSVKLHHQLSVCIVDPDPEWMYSWKRNFRHLDIHYLRSPAMAHPNMFDRNALLAYACQEGREKTELFESGCFEIKSLLGLGQTQVGLWKLPSTKLFLDFCDDMVTKLDHSYIQGRVMDVQLEQRSHTGKHQEDGVSRLQLLDSTGNLQEISARNIILAMGVAGRPIIPDGLIGCPTVSWKDYNNAAPPPASLSPTAMTSPTATGYSCSSKNTQCKKQHILVVGGGLTAVQVALRIVKDGNTCVLNSRRPLREKHFDISVEWFDQRTANKCLSEFYHDDIENRVKKLLEARDGGSVPPMYMERLKENNKDLECWVGDVEYCSSPQTTKEDKESDEDNPHTEQQTSASEGKITIRFEGSTYKFDKVVLACGVSPDCTAHPLIEKIHKKWPIPIRGGLPDVTEDLRWDEQDTTGDRKNATPSPNIFVVGAMAGLQVGPDAGNLMGIRRAALTVADSLDCRCWLREKALVNPFEALLFSDSDTESESESEEDCSTCCGEEET